MEPPSAEDATWDFILHGQQLDPNDSNMALIRRDFRVVINFLELMQDFMELAINGFVGPQQLMDRSYFIFERLETSMREFAEWVKKNFGYHTRDEYRRLITFLYGTFEFYAITMSNGGFYTHNDQYTIVLESMRLRIEDLLERVSSYIWFE